MNNKIKNGPEKAVLHSGYKINRAIKARQIRLIDHNGKNHGLVTLDRALELAEDAALDLVQITEDAGDDSVTAKIMDIGKFLYEKKKQKSIAKKNQKVIDVKELKFRPNIDENDYKIKIKQAGEFINKGKHVKITLQFKGRVISLMESIGRAFFDKVNKDLSAIVGDNLVESKESKPHNVTIETKMALWIKVYYAKDAE